MLVDEIIYDMEHEGVATIEDVWLSEDAPEIIESTESESLLWLLLDEYCGASYIG